MLVLVALSLLYVPVILNQTCLTVSSIVLLYNYSKRDLDIPAWSWKYKQKA